MLGDARRDLNSERELVEPGVTGEIDAGSVAEEGGVGIWSEREGWSCGGVGMAGCCGAVDDDEGCGGERDDGAGDGSGGGAGEGTGEDDAVDALL